MKIRIEVEVDDPKHVGLASAFLAQLAGGKPTKPASGSRSTKTTTSTSSKTSTSTGTKGKNKIKTLTIADVRAEVKVKAKIDKKAVVGQLKSYGVGGVSDLDPEHYEDFMEFLSGISGD